MTEAVRSQSPPDHSASTASTSNLRTSGTAVSTSQTSSDKGKGGARRVTEIEDDDDDDVDVVQASTVEDSGFANNSFDETTSRANKRRKTSTPPEEADKPHRTSSSADLKTLRDQLAKTMQSQCQMANFLVEATTSGTGRSILGLDLPTITSQM